MRLLYMLMLVLMPTLGFAQIIKWPPFPDGGRTLYILRPNGQTPCRVDFEDFIAFAQAYGSTPDSPNWNINADTNQDGIVSFPDFIAFAQVFGLSRPGGDECQQDTRAHIRVTGQVLTKGSPFANVWINAVRTDSLQDVTWEKTDTLGAFSHGSLSRGTYAFVPMKMGYVFTPDTLWTAVEDTSMTLASMEGAFSFGVVDVQVVREGERVSGVDVSFLKGVAGQPSKGPWEGMTDPSGTAIIRIPVLEGQEDITGTYIAKVTDRITGDVLGVWNSVPIQTDDSRRLVLDIGQTAYHIPERAYFYYNDPNNKFTKVSETGLRIWFKADAPESEIANLLARLGLADRGNYLYELEFEKGRFAILEMMYQLKRSGLVHAVLPALGSEFEEPNVFSGLLRVAFKEDVSEDEIMQIIKEMGATISSVVQFSFVTEYKLEIQDLLSYDLFEIANRYHIHPKVRWAQPSFQIRYSPD